MRDQVSHPRKESSMTIFDIFSFCQCMFVVCTQPALLHRLLIQCGVEIGVVRQA